MSEPAIIVKDVEKGFRVALDKTSGIKQLVTGMFSRKKGYREFKALDGVSLTIEKGEFIGIVGRNGSGKSTLLKILAGVYSPDKGGVAVNGSLTPFIELGVGFNPELSGRENIFLNGALLGFSHEEMLEMYDDIVEFAELHNFMEERLKNYSSGMQVRLAFSIAIRAKTDILVLDEVLAVGDEAFQQKCITYFEQLKQEQRTVILVTHSMDSVRRFCNRAILLENGKVKQVGSAEDIASQYTLDNIAGDTEGGTGIQNSRNTAEVELFKPTMTSEKSLTPSNMLEVEVSYKTNTVFDVVFGVAITHNGRSIAELNSKKLNITAVPGEEAKAMVSVGLSGLNAGMYVVDVAMFDAKAFSLKAYYTSLDNFVIKAQDETRGGPVKLDGKWFT